MSNPITIFAATNGLNTRHDPARIRSTRTGVVDLAVAGDVDVSDTGRISRRKGYTRRVSGLSAHSLFCDGGDCVFVAGDHLYLLHPDYSYRALTAVTSGARMSYAQVNDWIYFCNGYQKGIVADQAVVPWVKGYYVGPDTQRSFIDPPVGSIVAYYRGRMYVAQHNTLWHSEPFAYGVFDPVRGFVLFPDEIRMVRPVDGGIFVGTGRRLYFLGGPGPAEFTLTMLADYSAIRGTDTVLRGRLSPSEQGLSFVEGDGLSVLWLSEKGVCYGGPDGAFYNLTLSRIDHLPSGLTGAGVVYKGRYIGLIDP